MTEPCTPPAVRGALRPADTTLSAGVTFARVAVLAVGLLLLTRDLTVRFIGSHEDNGAIYGTFARHHIEYGLGYTKLYCTWGTTQTPPPVPERYLNHPPLIGLEAALPMLVFGDHEWTVRLTPIAATLGGVWLLMIMLSRLHGPALGLLAGLFYVMLPATGYFGRMLEYVPIAQFFNLLMLHGYMQWSGWYGGNSRRRTGAIQYAVGAVLGIGTAWNTVILAGLIWIWHVARTRFRRGSRGMLLALTLVPAAALAAVVVHILAGCGWSTSLFAPLLYSRTLGGGQSWAVWGDRVWAHLLANVSAAGVVAAVLYLGFAVFAGRRTSPEPFAGQSLLDRRITIPIALILLHGLLYVVPFRNQSFHHDYWQFPALPFFAAALATVVLGVHTVLAGASARIARVATLLLLLLPMPMFARGRDRFYERILYPPEIPDALVRLAEFVPADAPVMTSLPTGEGSEQFGTYTNRWVDPFLAYYARRPLIQATRLEDIAANSAHCKAYLLDAGDEPRLKPLVQQLTTNYESVRLNDRMVLFLLDRPRRR